MANAALPTCPKCDSRLHLRAAVFESLLKKVGLKNQTPFSRIFYCYSCKHLVWVDRKGKKSLKAVPPPKKAKQKARK